MSEEPDVAAGDLRWFRRAILGVLGLAVAAAAALALTSGYARWRGPFRRELLERVVALAGADSAIVASGGRVVGMTLDDRDDPATLRTLRRDEGELESRPGEMRLWAVRKGADLRVSFVTRDAGRGRLFGFAYSSRGWSAGLDLPSMSFEAKIDEHWATAQLDPELF